MAGAIDPGLVADTALASAAGTRTTPRAAPTPEGTKKAAEDFAAFFFTQTMESMFQGLGSDGLFGGGNGESVYRSLMTQEYGKVAARAGGLGIADAVQREIIRMQEQRQ